MVKKISIRDVAELAGVAVSTASMALNNNKTIKAETRQMVQKTAEQLGYIPNQSAQSLVGKKSKSIGVVFTYMANPIYLEEAESVKKYAKQCGYETKFFVANLGIPEERHSFISMVQSNVDGIICYPLPSEWGNCIQKSLANYGIKSIYDKFTNEPETDWVSVDYEQGGFLAADYLLSKGHRNIGIFTVEHDSDFPEREDGCARAFKKYGMKMNKELFFTCDTRGEFSEGYHAVKSFLKSNRNITALFMRADYLAIGALAAVNKLGLKAGKDISIVGFDNISQGEFTVPPLTTVGYDKAGKAQIMVDTLLKRINGDESSKVNVLLDPELIIRSS